MEHRMALLGAVSVVQAMDGGVGEDELFTPGVGGLEQDDLDGWGRDLRVLGVVESDLAAATASDATLLAHRGAARGGGGGCGDGDGCGDGEG